MNYQRLLESGVDHWNQWRHQNPNQSPDLRGIDLTNSYLFEINLMGSDLRGADFRHACLIGADFSRANLSGADLGGAYLSEASFREANLSNANLIDAQMSNVDLLQAILVGTCLEPVKHTVTQITQAYDLSKLPAKQTVKKISRESATESTSARATDNAKSAIEALERLEKEKEIYPEKQTLVEQFHQDLPHQDLPRQDLIDRCHHKLCDYYIGPMAKLILDDIITIKQPKTKRQFIELVAAHIPVPQDALSFRHSFSHRDSHSPPQSSLPKNAQYTLPSLQTSPKQQPQPNAQNLPPPQPYTQPDRLASKSALTQACIKKCQQELTEYYIAPMAQMLIDDIIATHQPKTVRQFVQLIADHLPADQIESFSRKVLS